MKEYNIGTQEIDVAITNARAIVGDGSDKYPGKASINDKDIVTLMESYGNLYQLEPILKVFNRLKDRMESYVKNHQEEYKLNCEDGTQINVHPFTETTYEFNSDQLKIDAQVQPLELKCKEEFKQYFQEPSVRVDPYACRAASDEFKAKYGVEKTKKMVTTIVVCPDEA